MNAKQKKTLQGYAESLEEIKSAIEEMQDEEQCKLDNMPEGLQDEEQCKLDNMPEGLQESERGEAMQEAIDYLESAASSLEDAIDYLNEITEV